MRAEERAFIEAVDTDYSYHLARQMELFKTNEASGFRKRDKECQRLMMEIFQQEQDAFVRLNWHAEVLFPQEGIAGNS